MRVAAWGSVALLAVLIVLPLAAALWLHAVAKAALPQLDGDVKLAGLSAAVTVRRDAHGVPHIDAATQDDLFVAQGYVTAQDRLWQMDGYRRNAEGELAEIMGPTLVKHDRAQRVLQFRRTAERLYAQMAPADRARLNAYARGVNLFIDQHRDALPPEFRLLHYMPKPWSGVDSLAVGTMMIETLDSRWDEKLGRERVARKLNNRRLEADLYPVGSWRDRPPTGEKIDLSEPQPAAPRGDDDDDDDRTQTEMMPQEDLRALRSALGVARCAGCTPGSNNWVISGQHTASGKPLLSNDMHLSLTAPNIWYMADLRAPGYHAAGVTLVGMPLVIAGHNEHVAWGFTALYADVQDLYVETLDGKGNYRDTDGSWKPLAVDHEVIHVRGGKDVTVDVQLTEHGPLLNPLFTREKRAIALKWSLYDHAFDSIPLYEMNTAANWTEFSAALEKWCWPTQNVVYADDQGHVAYQAVGKIPIRADGLTGVPVAAGTHEWQGYVPFGDLPRAVDPPSGFLATANSRVTTEKTKYPLSLEWAEPYRAERIYKMLEGRDGLTRPEMLAAQTDIYSEVDQELAHRFAYAIDHAAKHGQPDARGSRPDAELGWTADSGFCGGVTGDEDARGAAAHDSCAEAGRGDGQLRVGGIRLCSGRDRDAWRSCVASAGVQGLGCGACGCGAARDGGGQGSRRCEPVGLRQLACCGHRASVGGIFAVHWQSGRDGTAAAERRHAHGEAGWARVRAFAALHDGLERCGRLDGEHRAGRERESVEPVLPRPVERLLRGQNLRASLLCRCGGRCDAPHAAPDAMTKTRTKTRKKSRAVCCGDSPDPRSSCWRRYSRRLHN